MSDPAETRFDSQGGCFKYIELYICAILGYFSCYLTVQSRLILGGALVVSGLLISEN
jgi:hypothetical protein